MKHLIKTILSGFLGVIVALSFCFVISTVSASFNEQINYQGKIANSSGIGIEDGQYCIKFVIYDASTNGNELWSEEWNASNSKVTVTSGLFSVMLGSHTSISSVNFNNSSRYLEVQFDPACDGTYEEVFSPRKQLGAVPASFEAKQLAGYTWANPGTIGSGTANTGAFTTLSASTSFSISSLSGLLKATDGLVSTATDGTDYLSPTTGVTYSGGIAFPSVSGNSGKYLTTNGTTLSWGSVSGTLSGGTNNYAAYWTGATTMGAEQYLNVLRGGTGAGALTQGSVVFAGASGVYSQDNSNFFWDATSHRLGIGLTSPANQLQIRGTGPSSSEQGSSAIMVESYSSTITAAGSPHFSLFKSHSNSPGTLLATQNGEELGRLEWWGVDSNNASTPLGGIIVQQTGSANSGWWASPTMMSFYVGSASGAINPMNIDSSGNVGIGTSTPGSKLDIASGTLRVRGHADPSSLDGIEILFFPDSELGSGLANGYIQSYMRGASAGYRNLYIDAAKLVLNSNSGGNVGIANTNPQAKLDIGTAGTSLGTLRLEGNTSGYTQIQPSAAAGSWTMTLPANDGDANQVLTTNGSGVTSWVTPTGTVSGSGTQNYVTKWNNAGGTQLGNSLVYDNGTNVGIGTTSPGWNLDVYGTSYTSISATSNSNTTYPIIQTARSRQGLTAVQSGDVLGRFDFSGRHNSAWHGGSVSIYGYAAENWVSGSVGSYMTFVTTPIGSSTPQERIRIASDGNIGIGTSNPSTLNGDVGRLLNVAAPSGNVVLNLSTTTTTQLQGGILEISGGRGSRLGQWNTRYTDSSGDDAEMIFQLNNGSGLQDVLKIAATGNIGVSNVNPQALLDIGTSGKLGTIRLEGSTSGYVQLQPAAAAGSWVLTLPDNDGSAGQVLSTNGSGVTSWETVSANPGGSNTSVQYNNNGVFGGSSNFTYDGTTLTVLGTGIQEKLAYNSSIYSTFQVDNKGTLTVANVGGDSGDMVFNPTGSGNVSLLSDTGVMNLGGYGNTNNEDLEFDFETTSNTVRVSSDTGVTNIMWTGNLTLGGNTTVGTLVTRVKNGVPDESDANGSIVINSDSGNSPGIYFRYGGAWHYAAETAGFQIPDYETTDPISGEKIQEGDIVLGIIDKTFKNDSLHGIWVRWDSVKAQLLAEARGELSRSGAFSGGQVSGVDSSTLSGRIKNSLSSLGISVQDSVVSIKNLAVNNLASQRYETDIARIKKMEMVDSSTGEIYCTWISNGEWVKSKGSCGPSYESSSSPSVSTNSNYSEEPVPQPEIQNVEIQQNNTETVQEPSVAPSDESTQQEPPVQEEPVQTEEPVQSEQTDQVNPESQDPLSSAMRLIGNSLAGVLGIFFNFMKNLFKFSYQQVSEIFDFNKTVVSIVKNSEKLKESSLLSEPAQDFTAGLYIVTDKFLRIFKSIF